MALLISVLFCCIIIADFAWLLGSRKGPTLLMKILEFIYPIRDQQGRSISGPQWRWPNGHMIDKFLDGREKSKEWRAFGSVYRIWSCDIPEIAITTPEDVRAFHTDSDVHDKSASSNGGWFFHQLLGECMGLVNGTRWRRVRSKFSHAFTHRAVLDMSASISADSCEYVRNLAVEKNKSSSTVHASQNLMRFPFFCTAQSIYGPMTQDEKDRLWSIGQQSLALMRYVLSGGVYRFDICRLLRPEAAKELAAFREQWSSFNKEMYNLRRPLSPAPLIVSTWKQVIDGHLPENEILQTLSEMLFANLDVSSHVLTWLVTLLAENVEVQQKLRAEIRSARTAPNTFSIDYLNAKDSLLKHCFLESLRLRPFTVFSIPESSPSEKILGGFRIPPNTSVVVDTLAINVRNPFWGEDSHLFKPERFSYIKSAELRYNLFAFGFGTRKCLGMHFAETMVKVFVVHLLDQYELHLPSSEQNAEEYKVGRDTWVPTANVEVVLTKIA
ncbi:cytochrome P450 [Lepidopterella palustris CBS 459.81]|uniref:Cytochrome P450 n=1 Tax=Lepidopterella palustris CBS 459.81 TaxID=1314670 RepID=A0A8E2ELQ9_9PEZI|nr:cytochrome P450 [Lepidopterella palustris CBS 459.81]